MNALPNRKHTDKYHDHSHGKKHDTRLAYEVGMNGEDITCLKCSCADCRKAWQRGRDEWIGLK